MLDDMRHRYWELFLATDLKPDLRLRTELGVYLLCETCKRQTERYNRYKPPRKPRVLKFIRWS